jgi:hypothetical protein
MATHLIPCGLFCNPIIIIFSPWLTSKCRERRKCNLSLDLWQPANRCCRSWRSCLSRRPLWLALGRNFTGEPEVTQLHPPRSDPVLIAVAVSVVQLFVVRRMIRAVTSAVSRRSSPAAMRTLSTFKLPDLPYDFGAVRIHTLHDVAGWQLFSCSGPVVGASHLS